MKELSKIKELIDKFPNTKIENVMCYINYNSLLESPRNMDAK